jgi:hypothetical protein
MVFLWAYNTESSPVVPEQPADDEVRWYFQGMEYFALILNRTFTVMITDRMLCGAYVLGPIPSPPIPGSEWRDPDFYVGARVRRYAGLNVESPEFGRRHWFNFQYPLGELSHAVFDDRPKWGMGNVPYSGRIHIHGAAGWHREFILVGQQPGMRVTQQLNNAIAEAQAV